jgi:rhodanese-related sulfurtransferase
MVQVQTLLPTEALAFIQAQKAFVLDVRTMDEFRGGHLEEAVNIPLDALPYKLEDVPKERTIVVYCLHGIRSGKAAHFLIGKGYSTVYHIEGGLNAMPRI